MAKHRSSSKLFAPLASPLPSPGVASFRPRADVASVLRMSHRSRQKIESQMCLKHDFLIADPPCIFIYIYVYTPDPQVNIPSYGEYPFDFYCPHNTVKKKRFTLIYVGVGVGFLWITQLVFQASWQRYDSSMIYVAPHGPARSVDSFGLCQSQLPHAVWGLYLAGLSHWMANHGDFCFFMVIDVLSLVFMGCYVIFLWVVMGCHGFQLWVSQWVSPRMFSLDLLKMTFFFLNGNSTTCGTFLEYGGFLKWAYPYIIHFS